MENPARPKFLTARTSHVEVAFYVAGQDLNPGQGPEFVWNKFDRRGTAAAVPDRYFE